VLEDGGGISLVPEELRYIWPSVLDLMAEFAALQLRERWGGWMRESSIAPDGASRFGLEHFVKKLPAALTVGVLAVLYVRFVDPSGIAIVGEIPQGLSALRERVDLWCCCPGSHRRRPTSGPYLVVDCGEMFAIDYTGVEALAGLIEDMRERDVEVRLGRAHRAVLERLERGGVIASLGEDHVFRRIEDAVAQRA
jgi:hypothetical protein